MVTLQQLQYFRALAANGHLTRTAESLYITQATLSNVISRLEQQLGVKLFCRAGRFLHLTEIGTRYLECVNRALDALDEGQTMIRDRLQAEGQRVSFAANNSLVWGPMIRAFRAQYGAYSVEQINCSDADQLRRLLDNLEVDYVISGTTDFSLNGLEYLPFREEPILLCVPKHHRLAGRERVYLRELAGEDFINLPRNHPFQKFCDRLFQSAGVKYNCVMECDYRMHSTLIESGVGVILTSRSGFLSQPNGELVGIPLADRFEPRVLALIWNPQRRLSKAAEDFRSFVPGFRSDFDGA